jgi:hypothetical protein
VDIPGVALPDYVRVPRFRGAGRPSDAARYPWAISHSSRIFKIRLDTDRRSSAAARCNAAFVSIDGLKAVAVALFGIQFSLLTT